MHASQWESIRPNSSSETVLPMEGEHSVAATAIGKGAPSPIAVVDGKMHATKLPDLSIHSNIELPAATAETSL